MHYTVELLIKGDRRVSDYYERAERQWEQILESADAKTVEQLAARLSGDQFWFEENCGDRWVGQEIMAVVGIAQFYNTDDGFGPRVSKAKLVYRALRSSFCSLEVKGHANTVARSYRLLEELEGDE